MTLITLEQAESFFKGRTIQRHLTLLPKKDDGTKTICKVATVEINKSWIILRDADKRNLVCVPKCGFWSLYNCGKYTKYTDLDGLFYSSEYKICK